MGYLYAITHRLYKVLIILNSAAFKFNFLYKFLSNLNSAAFKFNFLYKFLSNLNSAAFKFNFLYKFLSNKKVAQDFAMSDFSLTLVL